MMPEHLRGRGLNYGALAFPRTSVSINVCVYPPFC